MKTGVIVAGTSVAVAAVTALGITYGVPALRAHDAATAQPAAAISAPPPAASTPVEQPRQYVRPPVVQHVYERRRPVCADCGVVESVQRVRVLAKPTGGGALLGGIAGAVLGHQMGRGNGRDLATVAGAAGGALLGNHIEETRDAHYVYDIRVLRNVGGVQVIRQSQYVPEGQKVRVVDGRVVAE